MSRVNILLFAFPAVVLLLLPSLLASLLAGGVLVSGT